MNSYQRNASQPKKFNNYWGKSTTLASSSPWLVTSWEEFERCNMQQNIANPSNGCLLNYKTWHFGRNS
jgi:hypothetical protein